MDLDLPKSFVRDFAALGVHGAMALIILAQVYFMIKALDFAKKSILPLATNHFKHIESAFTRLRREGALQRRTMAAHTEALKNNTEMIKSQGELLREVLKNSRARNNS